MRRPKGSPRITLSMVALLMAVPLFAQFEFPSMGARSAAMGGVRVALTDAVSAMWNLSALSVVDAPTVSLAARGSVKNTGLGYASLAAAAPLGVGTASATAVHFGDADYNEQQLSAGYALLLSDAISLGVAFHYLHSGTSDPYYDPLHRVTFSLAMQYRISELLTVGFQTFNPLAVIAENDDAVRLPATVAVGVAYRLTDELLGVAELYKNIYYRPSLRFGLEYLFLDVYLARVGVATAPVVYTFGLGMERERFGVALAAQVHSLLGMSPQLEAHYNF